MCNLKKIIMSGIGIIFILNVVGCNSSDGKITDEISNVLSESEVNNSISDIKEEVDNKSANLTDNTSSYLVADENIATDSEMMSKDDIILDYFNSALEEINNILNSKTVENVKERGKDYFVTFVDFIFYGEKIKGITFKELTDTTKSTVISITQKIDSLIMTKFPNYKDSISSTSRDVYIKASDILQSGKENIEVYIISKVGEEKYQEALSILDELKEKDEDTWNSIKDFSSNAYEKAKENLNSWYQDFKNS